MNGLTLTDTLVVDSVIWIRSLGDDELGPSRRMAEDLSILAATGGFAFHEFAVRDRAELLQLLNGIVHRAADGLRPILHFDCHGSRADGLFMKPSGEYLSWAQLADALRSVNVATSNNLCCVFGVCFGLQMSLALSLSKPSPYYLTIAPEEEVSEGILEARIAPFYREVFATANITQAYADVLKPELTLFHCKEIFARALATYIASNCVGRAADLRRERMLTAILRKEGVSTPNAAQLKAARTKVKAALAPSQSLIDRYAPKFLIGRSPGFGYAELKRLADGYTRRKQRAQRLQQR